MLLNGARCRDHDNIIHTTIATGLQQERDVEHNNGFRRSLRSR